MKKFSEKYVLITGGTSGIGLATALAFRDAGARVIVTGTQEESLRRAKEVLGDVVHVLRADAREVADAERISAFVRDRVGVLHALFLNAGVARFAPLDVVDEATYEDLMGSNVKGAVFTLHHLLKNGLLASDASVVVNTSVMQHKGSPAAALYAATKGALAALVRSLAVELAPIRVNAVSPGPIDTPIYGKLGMPDEAVRGFQASLAEKLPLRRMGRSDEVARAVLFLASPDASFVTGVELAVDGGWSAT